MKYNKLLIVLIGFLFAQHIVAKDITISGYIRDKVSKETLIGANVLVTNNKSGTTSNEYGFYSITVPETDTIGLLITYMGYTAQAKKLTTNKNLCLDIYIWNNNRQN